MKLRIASELHAAVGWVPIVPDSSDTAAYQKDVVIWITPHPNSHELARLVVDAVNERSSALPSEQLGGGK